MKFEKTIIYVAKDDVITSKKGFLQSSPISDKKYLCRKLKVIGNNCFESLGEKEEIEAY